MTVREDFQALTHVNPDWILIEILEFLGLYDNLYDRLGKSGESLTLFLDSEGNVVGKLSIIKDKEFKIILPSK